MMIKKTNIPKNKSTCIVVVLSLIVIVISTVGTAAFFSNGQNTETQIVLVNTFGSSDISLMNILDVEIIDRYGDFVLVEAKSSTVDKLINNGLNVDTLPDRTVISVKGHVFDVMDGYPEFCSELTIESYSPGTSGLYIVHMLGPVNPEWRLELEEMGVQVINYVPNYAYEVVMTPELAREVEELFFVDWVGIYQPAFKLAEGLRPGFVNIRLVEGVGTNTLSSLTSKVDVVSLGNISPDGINIIAEVGDEETLHEIARMNDVYYIDRYTESRLTDEIATQIIGGGCYFMDDEDGDPDTPYRKHGEYGSYMNQIGYKGEGIVIAVADSGLGDGTIGDAGHPDFTGRVIGGHYWEEGSWQDEHSHGTHCAGSIAGDTYHGTGNMFVNDYYSGQGSAPEALLYAVRIFDGAGDWIGPPSDLFDIVEVAKQEADAYIHSNSWTGPTDGSYEIRSERYDAAARDADRNTPGNQPMVLVAAAGNVRGTAEPGSMGSPASGKNVIAVGATHNYNPSGGASNDPINIASYSARGWTRDNRVKPDVVAPGSNVRSTEPGGVYGVKDGTSMAAPAVSGAAALIVEWYEERYDALPSPAMVKAILINTAIDLDDSGNTGPIPNQDEGWGMVDISKLHFPYENPVPFYLRDEHSLLTTGVTEEYHLDVDRAGEPVKISLVWTDKHAISGDNPTLKNDLNLEVESPSGLIYRGNAFSGGWTQPGEGAMSIFDRNGNGWDDTNNVENVYIHTDDVEMGTYTIRVTGYDIPEDANNDGYPNQDYALVGHNLVISGVAPSVTVNYPEGGEIFIEDEVIDIEWIVEEEDDPIDKIDICYSVDSGNSWKSIVKGISNTGTYSWTVPNENSPDCYVRVSAYDIYGRRGEGLSDGPFEIVGLPPDPPTNLVVEHHQLDEFVMVLEEDFRGISTGDIPSGWTRTSSIWGVSSTTHAGGQVPELRFGDMPTGSGVFRCYTPAIDTSEFDTLNLTYRHYYRPWSGSITLRLQTSTDGSSWSDVWSVTTSSTIDAEKLDFVLDETHGVGSDTLRISWTVDGTTNNMRRWCVDDIELYAEEPGVESEHNLVTWGASLDDPDSVSHYNIYRTEDASGPWIESIASVDATGSPTYSYVDMGKGEHDGVIWWYLVRAVGHNGLEEDNQDPAQEPGGLTETFDIPLTAGGAADGWNFVSFNLVPLSSSFENILSDIDGSYDRVMYYDASTGRWSSYMPGRHERFNSIGTWNHRMGMWIQASDDVTLSIEGTTPLSTDIPLYPGWNMVGLPSSDMGNHGLPSEVDHIGYFLDTASNNLAYDNDPANFVFEPGKGYWVRNPTDTTLTWQVFYDA